MHHLKWIRKALGFSKFIIFLSIFPPNTQENFAGVIAYSGQLSSSFLDLLSEIFPPDYIQIFYSFFLVCGRDRTEI